jgi:hypothetical protein
MIDPDLGTSIKRPTLRVVLLHARMQPKYGVRLSEGQPHVSRLDSLVLSGDGRLAVVRYWYWSITSTEYIILVWCSTTEGYLTPCSRRTEGKP